MNNSKAQENLNAIRCLGIKTTFLCNNRCGFCWQPHHATSSDISLPALKNLQPLIEAGNLKVIQPAGGEVFLWKGIKGFIEQVERYNDGVQMYLISNGTLFDDYWYSKAAEGFFSVVNFSINAPNRELYQQICGRDNFAKVRQALNTLGELRAKVGMSVQVSFVMTRPLIGKLAEFADLVAAHADTLLVREYRPSAFGQQKQKRFYRENHIPEQLKEQVCAEMAELAPKLAERGCVFDYSQYSLELNSKPIFSNTQTPSYDYSERQCNHLFNQIQVEHTGKVRLGCNFSGITLGNLHEQSIIEIMDNPLIGEERRKIVTEKNYISCPQKPSSHACPYALRQISEMSGIQRYISDLPEFVFPRNSLTMRQSRSQKHIQEAMNRVDFILNSKGRHVLELGAGSLTPILLLQSGHYFSDSLSTRNSFYKKIQKYFLKENFNFDNAYCFPPKKNNIFLTVINENYGIDDVRKIENEISPGNYLVINAGHYHSAETKSIIRHLLESTSWSLCKNFGFLVLLFKKNNCIFEENKLLLRNYNKTMIISEAFRNIPKNIKKIAIFCGGSDTHTLWMMSFYYLFILDCPIIHAVIYDNPIEINLLFGHKAQSPENFDASLVDAIVLSADEKQDLLRKRCIDLYGKNINVIDLYSSPIPVS